MKREAREDVLTAVISLVLLQIHIMLSGPTSPLEGSPTTLDPPPWKYISSSRFDTPYTKPGIFFAARTWAYKPIQEIPLVKFLDSYYRHIQLDCRGHLCRLV